MYLLFFPLFILSSLKAVVQGSYSKKHLVSSADFIWFNTVAFLIITLLSLLTLCIGRMLILPSAPTLVYGALFGVCTVFFQLLYSRALKAGPISITALIQSFALIIPTVCGVVVWHETLTAYQLCGVVMLLAAFVLSTKIKKDGSVSSLWAVYSLTAFFISGTLGLLQKLHRTTYGKNEIYQFIFVAFTTATFLSFIIYLLERFNGIERTIKIKPSTVLPVFICGAALGTYHLLALYLAGVVNSSILFPVASGGSSILTTVITTLFYKNREKLRPVQIAGIALGVVSILLISNVVKADPLF